MIRLAGARLVQIAVTMAVLSFAMFLLIGLMPGDPIDLAMPATRALTAADAARLRALHGLDQPLHARYLGLGRRAAARRVRLFAALRAAGRRRCSGRRCGSTLVLLGAALALAAAAGIALGAAGGGAAALGAGRGRARHPGAVRADASGSASC